MLEKALVVDNNAVILKLLAHILEKRGFVVRTAVDGLSALDVLEEFRPDIIFTDLIMPNIGGENLCRIVSGKKEFSSTILVVLSAIALEEDVDFVGFGAHAYIAKGPAKEMAENIDKVIAYIEKGRFDILADVRLGMEHLAHRAVTEELLEAKQHFILTLNNMDNGFLELSSTDRIVYCNSYSAKLFKTNEVELLGMNINELFPASLYPHVTECLQRFHNKCEIVESEQAVQVAEKFVVFRFVPLEDSNESSSIMLLRDITKERKATLELQEHVEQMERMVADRTQRYERVNAELQQEVTERMKVNKELELAVRQWGNTFDTISDYVSVHDQDMKIVRVNKALAHFLGLKPEEILGRHCYEIMHGTDTPWHQCPHVVAVESGKPFTFEVDDSHIGIPLLVTCSPLVDDDGTNLGTVHIARDISEQKKATSEREKLIEKLEESLAKVKLLSGFIPICASCKKIRDDQGYWKQVEEYICDHSEAEFSHSICPKCAKKLYPEIIPDE